MKQVTKVWLQRMLGITVFTPLCVFGQSEQIVLESSVGESYVLEVQSDDSFRSVLHLINQSLSIVESHEAETRAFDSSRLYAYAATPQGFRMQMTDEGVISVKSLMKKQNDGGTRDYYSALTDQEKTDIGYIVRVLSNDSLIKIKQNESSLKKAGDRVDNVHPFQFLFCIFSNEELKVGIRNIQGRSWVGKGFMEGITTSLSKESKVSNVLPYVSDFAGRLNIDVNAILPALQAGQWEKFVDILIKIVPRTGNSGRYDM